MNNVTYVGSSARAIEAAQERSDRELVGVLDRGRDYTASELARLWGVTIQTARVRAEGLVTREHLRRRRLPAAWRQATVAYVRVSR